MRVSGAAQSESELRKTLDALYAASKEGKSFTGLLELVTNEYTVELAVRNIKANTGSKTPGIDGKVVNDYLQLERQELMALVQGNLADYKPSPVKRVLIPKANGKMRPLGIPTMIDRIVQECLRIVLEPILEAKFFAHSYGFRPYRNTAHAVVRAVRLINDGAVNAVEGDIKGYFDNVNHRLLMRKLWKLGVIDKRVLSIVKAILKAGALVDGQVQATDKGTPQGGILSPLLANAYLNDFDWVIARRYADPKGNGYSCKAAAQRAIRDKGTEPCFMTRYADDWLIQCRTPGYAAKLKQWVGKYLKHRLKLELSEEKTLLTDSTSKPAKFLGSEIWAEARRGTPDNPSQKIVGKARPDPQKVKMQTKNICGDIRNLRSLPTDELRAIEIENINAKIVGAAGFYATGIASKALAEMDYATYRAARGTFLYIYGPHYSEHVVPVGTLDNRPGRHTRERRQRTHAVVVQGQTIGITLASITPIQYGRNFNQDQTPYTEKGRKLHQDLTGKVDPLKREPLYNEDVLWLSLKVGDKYNFEYYQNREAAYNQTLRKGKGKPVCMECGQPLTPGNRECRHKNPDLPLDKVNKTKNLVWLCKGCHVSERRRRKAAEPEEAAGQ